MLVHGPRQCGKTTLVHAVSAATDRTYVTFDDDVMRAAAAADLIRFVRDLPGPATLDGSFPIGRVEVVAGQTARLLNVSDLAAPFALSRPTIDGYLTLLRHVFLADVLPAWHRNRLKRLVKAPKPHIGDTGVGLAELGLGQPRLSKDRHAFGRNLETFVLQELRRHASGRDDDLRFHHYRDRDDYEVDIVVEQGAGAVAGLEVKGAATVTDGDFAGLRRLARAAGSDFVAGVVVYDGDTLVRFGERLFAVPVHALWQGT